MEGFAMHICITREMIVVYHKASHTRPIYYSLKMLTNKNVSILRPLLRIVDWTHYKLPCKQCWFIIKGVLWYSLDIFTRCAHGLNLEMLVCQVFDAIHIFNDLFVKQDVLLWWTTASDFNINKHGEEVPTKIWWCSWQSKLPAQNSNSWGQEK